jgi:hypothetical protein
MTKTPSISRNPARTICRPVFTLLALSVVCLPHPAHAQATFGMSPAIVIREFKPGQPFEFDLSVSNGRAAPLELRGVAMDWWYDEKNEKAFGLPGSLPRSASNWIAFVPKQFTVPPNGTGKVKVVVTPPPTASGGYYAVAFVESKPELVQEATRETKGVFSNIRLGCLLLLEAEGTENYKIEVSQAKLQPPDSSHNLSLDFELENQSNTHIFPRIDLAILSEDHRLMAKAEAETKRFLPGQKQSMSLTWAGALAPGSYTAVLTIVYGNDQIYTREFAFRVGSVA